MKPTHHLTVPWLQDACLQRIWRVLPAARLVGGAVRAAVQGNGLPDDIDMACPLPPEQVMAVAREAGLSVHPTGLAHGTVTVVASADNGDKLAAQITTLRRDIATDGRHAVVAYQEDWLEDARRRDFTFNTLLLDKDGALYDPLGCGLADLQRGHIVFVGIAAERLHEDYLRFLRFYRFWAQLGADDFSPDDVTQAALQAAITQLAILSPERVTAELLKLLPAPKAVLSLQNMKQFGAYSNLVKSDDNLFFIRQLNQYAQSAVKLYSPIWLLAANPDLGDLRPTWLRLPNQLWADMAAIKACVAVITGQDERAVQRAAYWHGAGAARSALILLAAEAGLSAEQLKAKLSVVPEDWHRPVMPVKSSLLMQQYQLQGAALGKTLKFAEQQWVESDFTLNLDALLQLLSDNRLLGA